MTSVLLNFSVIILCSVSVSEVYSNTSLHQDLENNKKGDFKRPNTYANFQEEIKNIGDLWKIVPLHIMENAKFVSPACSQAYSRYLKGLRRNDLNFTKMFDANAKLQSGILRGNVNQYGDFDECMELENGQYCLAEIDIEPIWNEQHKIFKDLVHSHFAIKETFSDPKHRVPGFTLLRWGFCIPKECTNVDLQKALLENLGLKSEIKQSMCQQSIKTNVKTTVGEYIAKGAFFVVGCATLFASVFYMMGTLTKANGRHWKDPLMCFCIQKNYEQLTTHKTTATDIHVLHGIRALSALALLMSHKTMALFYNPYINRTDMIESFGSKWSVIGRTAILYTESFMLLSGLLNANSLFFELEKGNCMKFKTKLISRIFRILPNLLAIILFCTFFLPHMGSGPIWPLVVNHHSELCQKYMWRNMLFIHNYYGFKDMCLTHTHQMGIDMQLFILTPLLVHVIWRTRKLGVWLLGSITFMSTLLRFWVTWKHELSHVVYFGIPISRMFKTADLSYILPTHRATIYLIGVCLAYILRYTNKKRSFSRVQLFFVWSLMYFLAFLVWFGPVHMSVKGFEYNSFIAALYGAMSPIFWGISVAWVIYSVERGFGSWFGPVLKWKHFIPFTKISYAFYLVQFPVFFYNVGKTRHAGEYKAEMMLEIKETGMILVLSFLLTLLIEIPFQNIRKILFVTETNKPVLKTEHRLTDRKSKLA